MAKNQNQNQNKNKEYQKMVDEITPNSKLFTNCLKAFVSGGLICVLGQLITNYCVFIGFTRDMSTLITTIVLIFLSGLLTGLGWYSKLGKFCGAGTIVPITGFANSVVSPAIEFKKEGFVFGLGAKIFIIAGPVIAYGTLTSVLVGLIYYFIGK